MRHADQSEATLFSLDGLDYLSIRWPFPVFALDSRAMVPPRTRCTSMDFDGSGTHDRLALPAHQTLIETRALFGLSIEVGETRGKAQVFCVICGVISSSRRRLTANLRIGAVRWSVPWV